MTLQPRPSILSVEPYVGGESTVAGVNRVLKLSSNEGAFGPPPGAVEAIGRVAREAHRYPHGVEALRAAIGARFGLDPDRVVCGNGSDELIALLILAYGGEGTELVMSAYGFTMYDITGRWAGCRVIKVPERVGADGGLWADVDAMAAACGPRTRMVFLANPNNPTGGLLPQAEVARLRRNLRPDVLLVLDAAYAEYVTDPGYDPGQSLVDAHAGPGGDNTVMTRTFSKIFGLGGMRLGWAYAPAAVIDVMNRVRGPFNVNAPAIAAGIAALGEPGWIERSVAHNAEWRARLATGFAALGVKPWPGQGNFLLADFGAPERARAADAGLRARGIILRAMNSYGLPHCLRATVGDAEECEMLLAALADVVPGLPGSAAPALPA